MDWRHMAEAIAALGEFTIGYRAFGDWYVDQPLVMYGHVNSLGTLFSVCGNGASPVDAIEDHWRQLTTERNGFEFIVVQGESANKHYRWNGFMWRELARGKEAA